MLTQAQLEFKEDFTRSLLDELLQADTVEQVHECLKAKGLLDDSNWLPYGGVANNAGQFLNQAADARGALVEKVVNGIDAVLMAKAYEREDFPYNLPQDMFQASERYFNIPKGLLSEVSRRKRGKIARDSLQVVFSGAKSPNRPTITIADRG